jgi:hypothetical protein
MQPVKATWVEGHITYDTIWKIQDSPFIVINDVIVDTNATLTIEPGVQVRFGGNFSLIVNGALNATGTSDLPIVFTSNKISPAPSDWNTIQLSSVNDSVLCHCAVEYGTNGISIRGSANYADLTIENCKITNCSIGVFIWNIWDSTGNVTIRNNEIIHNVWGMKAWWGSSPHFANYVLFLNNKVAFNKEVGIWFSRCHGLKIMYSKIYQNNQIGIFASHATSSEPRPALIAWNNVTAHYNGTLPIYHFDPNYGWPGWGRGLYYQIVSVGILVYDYGNSINITHNSVAFNQYGIYYDYCYTTDRDYYPHSVARYNDIYNNIFGINVSGEFPNAAVDAQYNYWGDPSGPYHPSLNPLGIGNPVSGNGQNLDFIPFLSAPNGYINQRPTARLHTNRGVIDLNQPVILDASNSTDDGRIDYYFFNFGDGTNSGWTTLSVVTHKYSQEGKYNATLIVMDDFGVTSLDGNLVSVEITVVPEFPSMLILPFFMIATLLIVIINRRKRIGIGRG